MAIVNAALTWLPARRSRRLRRIARSSTQEPALRPSVWSPDRPERSGAGVLAESPMDLIRILLAILLPPLGVFLQVGLGLHFWLNILLTLLGYIPGIVHAVWIIARK